ncbi:hypothetical protein ACQPZF_36175 [Actinosynnema sp. CS-041913]|uniref:hypothetical protein n=1 Tax=Actinosynnema sp. CS-041913 TaxID=3239917 RepID=UPI003D936C67
MGLLEVKFQPEINIAQANPGSSWFRRDRGRTYASTAECDKALIKLVTRTSAPDDYYVSAGTADFVVPWLQRLYRCAEISRGPTPKIRRLIFKCLSAELTEVLLVNKMIAQKFKERLEVNLRAISEDSLIRSHGVEIEVRRWNRLPPFHGHMFGENLIIGPWSIDSTGLLHAQTPVTHFRGRLIKEELNNTQKMFLD